MHRLSSIAVTLWVATQWAVRAYWRLISHPTTWVRATSVLVPAVALFLLLLTWAGTNSEPAVTARVTATAGPAKTPTPGLERIAVVSVWLRENYAGASWLDLIRSMTISFKTQFVVRTMVRNDAEGKAAVKTLCNVLTAYVVRSDIVVTGINAIIIEAANGSQLFLGSRTKNC